MSDTNDHKLKIIIEVITHPGFRGDWQVRCKRLLPWPIWFKSREHAISYAKWERARV
jgi:hypothetical protein